jgi:hypothetical protein
MLALFISITGLIETVAHATNNISIEPPGPNNSYFPQPDAPALGAQGPIIGSAIGGALVVVGIIGLAIRCKIISAQLNSSKKTKSKSWKNLKHIDKFETIAIRNPLTHRVERINIPSRFEITPV